MSLCAALARLQGRSADDFAEPFKDYTQLLPGGYHNAEEWLEFTFGSMAENGGQQKQAPFPSATW